MECLSYDGLTTLLAGKSEKYTEWSMQRQTDGGTGTERERKKEKKER